jgi:hypothetical protein
VQALEPQAQVCGVVAIPGEGVVSAEPVVDVGCDTGEEAVVSCRLTRSKLLRAWRSKTAWNMTESFRYRVGGAEAAAWLRTAPVRSSWPSREAWSPSRAIHPCWPVIGCLLPGLIAMAENASSPDGYFELAVGHLWAIASDSGGASSGIGHIIGILGGKDMS